MAIQMKLGGYTSNLDDITFDALCKVLGVGWSSSYKSYVVKRGLKVRRKKISDTAYRHVVNIDDFWEWAEKNQDILHFDRFEENMLGKEPQWAKEKRKRDVDNPYIHNWSPEKESRLAAMLRQYKYTWEEFEEEFGCCRQNLSKKMIALGLKERPLRKPNSREWTDEEMEIMETAVLSGKTVKEIQLLVPRKTISAIQNKLFVSYGSKSIKKCREYLRRQTDGGKRNTEKSSQRTEKDTTEYSGNAEYQSAMCKFQISLTTNQCG